MTESQPISSDSSPSSSGSHHLVTFQSPIAIESSPSFGINSTTTFTPTPEKPKRRRSVEKPEEDVILLNRPKRSAFNQQRLSSWQPILTPHNVLPAFFIIGLVFLAIGVGLLLASRSVQEIQVDYTYECRQLRDPHQHTCYDLIKNYSNIPCKCRVPITLPQEMEAPVFVYYGLKLFHQNHLKMAQSFDYYQLKGYEIGKSYKEFYGYSGFLGLFPSEYLPDKKSCAQFYMSEDKYFAPCGALPRAMFNDTFRLFKIDDQREFQIGVVEKDITWPVMKFDKHRITNYRNPSNWTKHRVVKPHGWGRDVWDLNRADLDDNGYQNEHFIVWMQPAAFPDFRKFWGRVDHDKSVGFLRRGLPAGSYEVEIDYNFPVDNLKAKGFGLDRQGRKLLILTNTSLLGGRSEFLGIAYLAVGACCLVGWLILAVIVKFKAMSPKEMVDINRKTPYFSTEFGARLLRYRI